MNEPYPWTPLVYRPPVLVVHWRDADGTRHFRRNPRVIVYSNAPTLVDMLHDASVRYTVHIDGVLVFNSAAPVQAREIRRRRATHLVVCEAAP